MASTGRILERVAVALGLAVLAVALGVALLTGPWFTHAVTGRLDVAAQAGLSADRATDIAEQVRRFVTESDAPPLPAEVDGRAGFDPSAVSHLADVRDVVLALRYVSLALAAVLAIWLIASIRLRRFEQTSIALRWGTWACLAFPIVLALAGLLDFDALFSAFHSVFFEAGTWVFPADSLLIELFPETFWAVAGASLALLVAAQGVVMWLASRALRTRVVHDAGVPNGPEA